MVLLASQHTEEETPSPPPDSSPGLSLQVCNEDGFLRTTTYKGSHNRYTCYNFFLMFQFGEKNKPRTEEI